MVMKRMNCLKNRIVKGADLKAYVGVVRRNFEVMYEGKTKQNAANSQGLAFTAGSSVGTQEAEGGSGRAHMRD